MHRGGRGHRRSRNGMLYLLAIHLVTQFAQLERKPPVTACLVLANTLVFLRPGILNEMLPTIHEVCLNPYLVLKNLDVKRLFLSAFYHVDETHLVYNMLSLLWKGVQLESSMGSKSFAWMVAVLLGLSHGLVVLTAKGLAMFADYPDALLSECGVGFSAVLFALKVILNWNLPTYADVYGVLVPARHAAWAELLLVQMFVPGTSFLGHLSGILAGLIYLHSSRWFAAGSGSGRQILLRLAGVMRSLFWPIELLFRPFLGRRGRIFGRGLVGSGRNNVSNLDNLSSDDNGNTIWRCTACTYDNEMVSTACEICGAPRIVASAPPWPAPGISSALSMEELREARLAHFSR
eukprot:c21995_g1_i1 orf=318-1361(+)